MADRTLERSCDCAEAIERRIGTLRELASTLPHGASLAGDETGLEHEVCTLSRLHLASTRLHQSLDREAVLGALGEIVANLLGSEDFAVLGRIPDSDRLEVLWSVGPHGRAQGALELGGELGTALAAGRMLTGPLRPPFDVLTLAAPLVAGDELAGALLIFRLLPQKPQLTPSDLELVELLSAQGGLALFASGCRGR